MSAPLARSTSTVKRASGAISDNNKSQLFVAWAIVVCLAALAISAGT